MLYMKYTKIQYNSRKIPYKLCCTRMAWWTRGDHGFMDASVQNEVAVPCVYRYRGNDGFSA